MANTDTSALDAVWDDKVKTQAGTQAQPTAQTAPAQDTPAQSAALNAPAPKGFISAVTPSAGNAPVANVAPVIIPKNKGPVDTSLLDSVWDNKVQQTAPEQPAAPTPAATQTPPRPNPNWTRLTALAQQNLPPTADMTPYSGGANAAALAAASAELPLEMRYLPMPLKAAAIAARAGLGLAENWDNISGTLKGGMIGQGVNAMAQGLADPRNSLANLASMAFGKTIAPPSGVGDMAAMAAGGLLGGIGPQSFMGAAPVGLNAAAGVTLAEKAAEGVKNLVVNSLIHAPATALATTGGYLAGQAANAIPDTSPNIKGIVQAFAPVAGGMGGAAMAKGLGAAFPGIPDAIKTAMAPPALANNSPQTGTDSNNLPTSTQNLQANQTINALHSQPAQDLINNPTPNTPTPNPADLLNTALGNKLINSPDLPTKNNEAYTGAQSVMQTAGNTIKNEYDQAKSFFYPPGKPPKWIEVDPQKAKALDKTITTEDVPIAPKIPQGVNPAAYMEQLVEQGKAKMQASPDIAPLKQSVNYAQANVISPLLNDRFQTFNNLTDLIKFRNDLINSQNMRYLPEQWQNYLNGSYKLAKGSIRAAFNDGTAEGKAAGEHYANGDMLYKPYIKAQQQVPFLNKYFNTSVEPVAEAQKGEFMNQGLDFLTKPTGKGAVPLGYLENVVNSLHDVDPKSGSSAQTQLQSLYNTGKQYANETQNNNFNTDLNQQRTTLGNTTPDKQQINTNTHPNLSFSEAQKFVTKGTLNAANGEFDTNGFLNPIFKGDINNVDNNSQSLWKVLQAKAANDPAKAPEISKALEAGVQNQIANRFQQGAGKGADTIEGQASAVKDMAQAYTNFKHMGEIKEAPAKDSAGNLTGETTASSNLLPQSAQTLKNASNLNQILSNQSDPNFLSNLQKFASQKATDPVIQSAKNILSLKTISNAVAEQKNDLATSKVNSISNLINGGSLIGKALGVGRKLGLGTDNITPQQQTLNGIQSAIQTPTGRAGLAQQYQRAKTVQDLQNAYTKQTLKGGALQGALAGNQSGQSTFKPMTVIRTPLTPEEQDQIKLMSYGH